MTGRGTLVLAAGMAAACVAWPPARHLAWLAVRGVALVVAALVAELVERRRHQRAAALREAPAQVPGPGSWWCTLYLSHNGRTQVLRQGMVKGPWARPVQVEGEVLRRYVQRYGLPEQGRLACRAVVAQPEGMR